jgi:capsular exopolysaccharide synthesis family protein
MENKVEDKKLNIDLADYWMIIRKRFISVILIFMLIVIATVYYTVRMVVPEYQATVKIKLSLRQPMATIQGAQITWYGSRGNEIPSEIKLIKNKTQILASVIDILRNGSKSKEYLENQEFFKEKTSKARVADEKIIKSIDSYPFTPKEILYIKALTPGSLGGTIGIDQITQTNIVGISVKSPFRDICTLSANVLAIVYNIDYWKSKTTQAKESLDFIREQLNNERNKIVKTTIKLQETSKREAFLGSEKIYKQELTTMRIELERLKERYKEKHPRIIKQKQLIKKLEADLAKIPVVITQHEENKMDRNIQQEFLATLEGLELKANIDYQSKKAKAQEEIQVIARATSAPKLKPNVPMNIVVGIIFGIIIGCLFAFVWEGLDTSIGKIEDVERITGLPVIAHIPLIGQTGNKKQFFRPVKIILRSLFKILTFFIPFKSKNPPIDLDKKVLFNFDSMSIMAEAYRTLRTNIQFAIGTGKGTGNIIAITSTSPREGKTLTSTNLAIALAQMGKTALLVEADMRRPQIAELFQISAKPGLSDLLIGTGKPDRAIRTITDMLIGGSEWDKLMETQGIDNLNILPCGTIPPNPTELLISPEFRDLMETLRKRYDFIIIDTPPSLPVSDASIVGTVVDGTVLIYQSDTTSRHLLLRAIQTLKKNHAKLLGIVINQLSFDVTMRSKSGYGYSYNYVAHDKKK